MRSILGDGFPLMVDANMKWSADEAIRRARALARLRPGLAGGADHPDDVAGHARILREGGLPVATGENFRTCGVPADDLGRGVTYPEPTSPTAAASRCS
jgi:L-alanine-DL-glutamate epimerase-like enolase superfamily enzyme